MHSHADVERVASELKRKAIRLYGEGAEQSLEWQAAALLVSNRSGVERRLRSALARLDQNFDLLLAGKPVRDVEETKAEARTALDTEKEK